jgi:hypothetical protein
MTAANDNFRNDDSWWVSDIAELRRVYQAIRDEAKTAALVKPGMPGFLGVWPNAERLGYSRNGMAFILFRTIYEGNL